MRLLTLFILILPTCAFGQIDIQSNLINSGDYFPILTNEITASILYDQNDLALIKIASEFLADDIEKVTGKKPTVLNDSKSTKGKAIIIGSIGNNEIIDRLIKKKKLDVSTIVGTWERYIIQTVRKPVRGIDEALVIVGSDKRGAAYGVFDISKAIGVSPWYWWADAPVQKKEQLYIKKDTITSDGPAVKYRGIFINDEAPALTGWVGEKFGSFGHEFYEKVFELLLRNKANYLWPAMWRPRAFSADDPLNPKLADDYGIVISTSHHEPMMRAHDEWSRFGEGPWNYEKNKDQLDEFWKGGIERMGDYESVVTVGMRGDGDEAMSEETAVPLMKDIIANQRRIIEEVTNMPAEETPQVWAIYKEVQDYYDKGMRVDDDIMVLFCDDNWGNVRILPKKEDLNHEGGFGMYYHFDFVGGPVSYRWLNVTQIERVWEQMNLSYQWGVDDLWIVNVGDIKPMELPISFFLDFAWDADDMDASDLPQYYVDWATQQFGPEHAAEIADLIRLYTKYSARRTPEMLKPDTYSISNYREAERVLDEYEDLYERSMTVFYELPESHHSAYYQLVHFPIEIARNLNEMYIAAGRNRLYGFQNRTSTNLFAEKVKRNFFKDAELTKYFHDTLADGKWNHFMAQTHIGYTSWNNPPVNKMPEISYTQIPDNAGMGYIVEHGTESRWSRGGYMSRSFSTFDPYNNQTYYLEIFNRGREDLQYKVSADADWIKLSQISGTVNFSERVYVSIDWEKVPKEVTFGTISITSNGGRDIEITVPVDNLARNVKGYLENNGVVSIEASHFTEKKDENGIQWIEVPNLGRTGASITVEPANAPVQQPNNGAPLLSYDFTLFRDSDIKIETYLAPTLNFKKEDGLKFAIAIDDAEPKVINIHEGDNVPDWEYPDWWNNSVTDHVRKKLSEHGSLSAGVHTLNVWMIDPGVVFQKFVIDAGGLKESYLGPPESIKVE